MLEDMLRISLSPHSVLWCVPMCKPYLSALVISSAVVISGCSSVPLKQAGSLSSYERLSVAKGTFTKSRTYVDKQSMSSIRTVSIVPTTLTIEAASRVDTVNDRNLVANVIDRAMCVGLSDKFEVVPLGQPADLTVRAVITDVVVTNKTMAGVSTAVSLGSSLALPVGIPRLPIGLGGLAVEGEAVDKTGAQRAAVVWSKGANSITNSARVSQVGDAYSLASNFGGYFSRIISTGKPPQGLDISIPSGQRIRSAFGGKPKYAACDAFGRSRGLAGVVADKIGAPPQWTEKQPEPSTKK
jgi:hypothetical protein